MIEVTRLRVFREVARRESFTATAEALHMSQPSVSNQVAQLEREVGARLLDRGARRVRLTPAGEVLLSHVEAVLLRLADAQREISETVRIGVRRLRVAAFPTAAATLLPPAVADFRSRLPEVDLELIEADPPVTLPALLAGEHDMVLVYDYPALSSPLPDGVDLEPLFVDQMAVALPADHPLAAQPQVTLGDLALERWCAPNPCLCRDAFEYACRRAGFSPEVVSQTNDYMAMQGLVASGVGIAVLPRLAAAIALRPGIVIKPLAPRTLERVTFIASRAGFAHTAAADALRSALRRSSTRVGLDELPLETFDLPTTTRAPATRTSHRERVTAARR
jgi:DNA-binding transcriptional LysR family regulator